MVSTNSAVPISGRFPGDIQDTFLQNSRRFYVTSHTITPEIIVILFTGGLPYVQCTKSRPTCENYIANCKILPEEPTEFQEISSISRSNFKFEEL